MDGTTAKRSTNPTLSLRSVKCVTYFLVERWKVSNSVLFSSGTLFAVTSGKFPLPPQLFLWAISLVPWSLGSSLTGISSSRCHRNNSIGSRVIQRDVLKFSLKRVFFFCIALQVGPPAHGNWMQMTSIKMAIWSQKQHIKVGAAVFRLAGLHNRNIFDYFQRGKPAALCLRPLFAEKQGAQDTAVWSTRAF